MFELGLYLCYSMKVINCFDNSSSREKIRCEKRLQSRTDTALACRGESYYG
jgi:glucose dehydrogenase